MEMLVIIVLSSIWRLLTLRLELVVIDLKPRSSCAVEYSTGLMKSVSRAHGE